MNHWVPRINLESYSRTLPPGKALSMFLRYNPVRCSAWIDYCGACIIRLFTAVIPSVTWKASVYVKASKK
jgi:hypothetical protein